MSFNVWEPIWHGIEGILTAARLILFVMLDDCAVDLVVDAPDSTLEPAACESTRTPPTIADFRLLQYLRKTSDCFWLAV